MSDALTQLNNIRTLRSQTREMSLDVLEDVLEKFKIILIERREEETLGNDSNLLIVFYVQIMPDDFVMQLHRF